MVDDGVEFCGDGVYSWRRKSLPLASDEALVEGLFERCTGDGFFDDPHLFVVWFCIDVYF